MLLQAQDGFAQRRIEEIDHPFGTITPLNQDLIVHIDAFPYFGVCGLSSCQKRVTPASWLAKINDAKIHQPSFAVTSQDVLWQLDAETELPLQSAGYSSYFSEIDAGRYRLMSSPRRTVHIERAILLAGRVSYSYFHLAFEHIPKLDLLSAFPEYLGWPVIGDNRLAGAARELFIKAVGSAREIIWPPPDADLLVSQLGVISSRAYLPDDPSLNLAGAVVDPRAVSDVAKRLAALQHPAPGTDRDFIWISRRKYAQTARSWGAVARDIHNGTEIEELFAGLGADIVSPEILGLKEQQILFMQATMVGMAAGSAMTNLIFCRPGTKVLIISQDKNVNPGLLVGIAQACRLKICWVFGAGIPTTSPPAHWSFVVDPLNVKRAVRFLNDSTVQPDGYIPPTSNSGKTV